MTTPTLTEALGRLRHSIEWLRDGKPHANGIGVADMVVLEDGFRARAAEIERLTKLADERGANEARMLERNAELQAEVERLRAQQAQQDDAITWATNGVQEIVAERDALKAELERLRAQVAPDGWKLVPVEMTDEMRDAGNEVVGNRYLLSRAYAAMLAASPAAPAQQDTTAPAGRARLAESGGSRACAVVPAPAQQAEPCDMGEICIGCQPRAVDGGCPHAEQAPSLTVGEGVVPDVAESLLLGQAQQLISALMNHGLIPKSAPEEQYLKLWDVVKGQLRCVNREGGRAALAAHPPAQGLDEQAAFEAWLLSAKFEDCPFKDDPERVKRWGAHYDRYRREGWDARAALAQAPAAEPLTLDEIEAEARKRWYAGDVDNVKFAAGVRFAERAHGIGAA